MYERNIHVEITAQTKAVDACITAQEKTMFVQVDKDLPTFPEYTGATVFTPTQQEQVAETMHKVLLDNIIINPIPSNYGLVTYNGSFITVS